MTNKKFKVAAMSMALTACVAAQPLIANAADEVDAVSNDANVNESHSEGESTASAPVAAASVSSDPETNKHDEGAVDVIGDPDISVDYDHDKDKVTKDDSSTTTESTGTVNRDVPKESEPGAQQPSGDGQQTEGDGQQTEGDGQQTEGNGQQTEGNGQQTEGDLNNEQEGPKDGGSETEKKPIGEAEKSETETKDTELVLGKPTTTTTTTTNPDGSTTTTTTTTTDAALETTTTVKGEASAKTEEDSSEDVKKTLKEELDGALSWDTETNTKFGDYTVTDAVEKDGKKEFTLTKEDKIETGEMTGLDISKLIEAGYKDNGDGTYTLTKEFTDSQGQKQTTTVKVDSSTATKTTSTTLTVTMASQEHEKTEELGTKEDTNYPYPSTDITVKDDKGKEHTFNVTDILGKAHDKGDGTLIYEDKENNLTYTITKNETDTKLDSLTDTELRDLLNDHAGSEKYTLDNEGNLCYITDKGEKCRVTNEQNTLLRSVLKLGITITDHHGKESDTQKVENSDKTPEQAKADAKETAQEEALKDALAQAINKETGKNLTKDDIDLPEVRDGKFEWTDTATRKTYTFIYTEEGTVSSSEEIKDLTTVVDPNASSAEKNTETGSAEVTGSTVIWTEKDQTIVQNDTKTDTTFGKDFDFKHIPDGFELDGDAVYNNDGTLKSFKTKDGKTYEFTYAQGSAPDTLTDISNADFTKVTWKMTEKKIGSATSPDTSEPTHIEIERNFRKKTEDNGTFTFTETKKDGKTYSGLKKVAGEDNLYRNDDGTVTITVTTSELGVNEIRAALEDKGYTEVNFNSDGTVSYKDGNVTYNVTYNTTVESITVKTKEVVKESSTISASDTNQKEAEDALKAKIAELQAGLKEGEYIEVNGHHVDQHTKFETIITYFKTAINYKNMSDAEIVAMLKKQKDDADAEGKTYTGEGVKHNWDGSHSTTGSNPNYIGHLDLATDSDLHLEDGSTADAILLNTGDKKFKFEWNMSAEDLVNKDKKDNRAKFDDSISYDEGKMNDGSGSGELGHYEYERKYTGSWIAPDSNNYPHESAYYRLTGTIAYNSLEDGKEYGTWDAANEALADWRAANPNATDYKPNIVALSKKDKRGKKITVYKAYTYESSLTAYGYMSKDSNTCVNIGYGKDEYGRPKWAGGFDLRISGLTQVTKTESSAHGKNYYDYYADITKYKTVEQTSRPLANRLLDVIPGTKTVPTETTNTDTGSGLFGSYDQNHNETHNYEKPFTGAGTAEYTTYRTWADTTADWHGEYEKLSGAFGFNYTTTKDAKVTEASKKTGVKTDSSVKYHYSYVERQELDPITETKTVTTPDDDDGDGGDKIIEEKDPDSPVLPGTPELPPVQDAKPDAPVLPADPALPAVQDAHALPQTGVNWLAAIGLALSGMTLMITGAFASLTGKNAKR